MDLEARFDARTEEWSRHCQSVAHSSSSTDYHDCEPFRQLVALGAEALPLIQRVYAGEDTKASLGVAGWAVVVQEIVTPDFAIPEAIRGKIDAIREYTLDWLDEHMNNYVSPSQ